MCYWGGNIFTIPVSFMVTVCAKGREILAVKQLLFIVDTFVLVLCKTFSLYSQ